MEFTYVRDDVRHRVEARAAGAFSPDEIIAILERQRREGIWHYALLLDGRSTTGAVTFRDLDRIRALETEPDANGQARGPLAIVVSSPDLYRRACAYAVTSRHVRPVEVFDDRTEAERWLEEVGF